MYNSGAHFYISSQGPKNSGTTLAIDKIILANLMLQFDFAWPVEKNGEDLDVSEIVGLSIRKKVPLLALVIMCRC